MKRGRLLAWCLRCGRPERIKAANGWLTIFWLLNIPPVAVSYFVIGSEEWQRMMILYLAVISIWANVASHFTGWVAGRVEVQTTSSSG